MVALVEESFAGGDRDEVGLASIITQLDHVRGKLLRRADGAIASTARERSSSVLMRLSLVR
jgi:hypothetical protein